MELMEAIKTVFSYPTILWIALGELLGILLGALPGLTATMGMALVLPFTFYLDPAASVGLMLGVYFGGVTGASIPAILFGIPGNPNAIATIHDGYQLARKGQAGVALGTAVVASFIGGLGSMLILFVAAPVLAAVSLWFGPAEYASLALASLTVIAATSGRAISKGVLAAVFGMMLGTVGIDQIVGLPRFTLGNIYLLNGFSLVAALIGLFGIAQVLQDLESVRTGALKAVMPKLGKLFPPMRYLLSRWRMILESVGLGTVIGILPGAGASVGVVLAYERARETSPEKEQFGKGALDGVLAPEVTNNACIGGGLIPTLALGIPGESAAVMLMAALIMHGITPGPLLFDQHIDLVYTIFVAMVVSNIFMLVFQLGGVRLFARALMIPPHLLSSLVLILSIIGAFALESSIFDAFAAVAFGILGWWMKKAGYPVIPLVLGLILGPMIESEFRRAVMLAGTYTTFFTRPLSLVMLLLGAAYLVHQIFKMRREAAREAEAGGGA